MKILIVEDEPLAAEKLEHMVLDMDNTASIVGVTGSIQSTVRWLQQNSAPDIILMDIELSDGQSFDIFNQTDVTSMVIFTTSYDEYAIRAFKVNSIDYLLKPVQKDDLKAAFEKYRKLKGVPQPLSASGTIHMQSLLKELQKGLQPKDYRKRFLVKVGTRHLPIEVETIAYFYVEDRSVWFKTQDHKRYIVDYTLDEIETMLDGHRFFRINRSFMVSIESIRQMHDYFNSRLLLTLSPDTDKEAIVSREKVGDFKKWIGK